MKLSEAIRAGALKRPMGFCALAEDGKTCAFGAALDAMGYYEPDRPDDHGMELAYQYWPWVEEVRVDPATFPEAMREWLPEQPEPVAWLIPKLNDEHLMTREEIADWVATIEPETTPASSREEITN